MKTLLLMRHAKSSWDDETLSDQQRPLNDRGRRDIPKMGDRLSERRVLPDMIMSSPAERARHTATIIAPYVKMPASRVVITPELYMANADVFLSLMQLCDENVDTLMMVSHNPGITQFASTLTDAPIDHMPTAAIFICQFDVKAWHQVNIGMGQYIAFEYPKKY
ncbi:MAG: histidine phosphatase family protein [Gammaproteobacteria bacterium]